MIVSVNYKKYSSKNIKNDALISRKIENTLSSRKGTRWKHDVTLRVIDILLMIPEEPHKIRTEIMEKFKNNPLYRRNITDYYKKENYIPC